SESLVMLRWNSLCSTVLLLFFFSSRRRHTRSKRDWSSDVCSSDLSRTERFLAAVLVDPALYRRGDRSCHVRPPAWLVRHQNANMDRTRIVDSSGALGRAALLRTWLAICHQPQPQYVDPHWPWHWRGIYL